MESSLEHLVAEGVVSEIVGRLKSGKEADVYLVRYGGEIVAAKVYKDRAKRSFKNNALYKEGRSVRSSRSQRAIDSGSRFGKAAEEDAWKATEATTLYKLHGAGVRVPTPVMFLEGVLLMELVRGADGEPAPRVIDVDLTPEEANAAYLDMLSQLVRILSCDLIHGDLSAYNVLWSASGPTIIDFPQIVSAAANSNSEHFFLRDARNILGHFASVDPSLRARGGDAREIWRAYVRRELTHDFLPSGRPAPPEPPPRVVEQRERPRGPQHQGAGPRGPQHQNDQRPRGPQHRGSGPREPQHQNDQRPRGPQHQGAGPRGPQHQNDQRPRGPQHQNDQRPRGPQHQNDQRGRGPQPPGDGRHRGPQQHHGDARPRGPLHGARGPQHQGPRPPRAEHGRPSGGRQSPAPEVIVIKRRSREASPPVDPRPRDSSDAATLEPPGRHRPRRRS